MHFSFTLLSLLFVLFHAHAQIDTGTTRPLWLNTNCIKKDDSNMSLRKNVYDREAYETIQAWSTCSSDSFPTVNFNKYLLLNVTYSYSGCEQKIDRKMLYSIDHINKKLTLYLIVYEKGVCRPSFYKNDIFPIPVIPDSYRIEIHKPDKAPVEIIPAEE